jgi:NAD-dependent SIR2 family protein deacetylase
MFHANLLPAARAVAFADALLITAGAGIGVDSGLPDFRGPEGFWRAYPAFAKLNLHFHDLANPQWFHRDPALAWGFYGHRLRLYRHATPHEGFSNLLRWAKSMKLGYFVFTSNVDGQFQKAGFDPSRILECHGSIHHLQCSTPCGNDIWPADNLTLGIDETTMRAKDPLPRCPRCGAVARPNVLMFGDGQWLPDRTDDQEPRYADWLANAAGPDLTIVEIGAGSAVPTVRWQSEELARRHRAKLLRINPREPDVPDGGISTPLGALDALRRIDAELRDGRAPI